jgi:hypothetical protein
VLAGVCLGLTLLASRHLPDDERSGDARPAVYPSGVTTGVPAGWQPSVTHHGDLIVAEEGAVVDGYLVTGSIEVAADDVTIRNSRVYGRIWNESGGVIHGGLLVEDVEIGPEQGVGGNSNGALGPASYTARRVEIHGVPEGFRVGARSLGGGPVVIEDSYVRLDVVPGEDNHMDAVQGYDGAFVTLRHNTLDARATGTNAAVFIADDSLGATVVDNLLIGGAYVLRLLPDPGADYPVVTGNRIVADTWDWGPTQVDDCTIVGEWSDNRLATIDPSYRVTDVGAPLDHC